MKEHEQVEIRVIPKGEWGKGFNRLINKIHKKSAQYPSEEIEADYPRLSKKSGKGIVAVRAVIDTNIWVSSLLNPHGYPAKLRKVFEEGLIEVIISEPILEEIADVLSRPRIKDKY